MVNKAIQRLTWRFSDGKSFKPNDNDIEAMNNIITWVNNQRTETINNNHLFAKLYMYVYGCFLNYYKATPLSNIPQSELSRLLDSPMNLCYTDLFDIVNHRSTVEWMIEKGLQTSHLEETTEQEKEVLKNLSEEDLKVFFDESWKFQDVVDNVNLMITESLNKFQDA